jgi:hypothetical protein
MYCEYYLLETKNLKILIISEGEILVESMNNCRREKVCSRY